MKSEEVFNELYEMLKKDKKPNMIIGITGFVGSGKTYFAREFEQFLKDKNINVVSFSMDFYNSSTREDRNIIIKSLKESYDLNWPRRAYPQNTELIKRHLTNIKLGKSFSANNLCNPSTKELDFSISFSFDEEGIRIKLGSEEYQYTGDNIWVICDGVKLVKYKDLIDKLIFLKADYDKLRMYINQKIIRIIPTEETLMEFDNFSYKIGFTGKISYSAPDKYHDDIVLAHALGVWSLNPIFHPAIIKPKTLIQAAYERAKNDNADSTGWGEWEQIE